MDEMVIRSNPKWMILKTTIIFVSFFLITQPVFSTNTTPRLILQITVDQLRGDLPGRFAERFSEGGFLLVICQAVLPNASVRGDFSI
jgi:hypothetical protein